MDRHQDNTRRLVALAITAVAFASIAFAVLAQTTEIVSYNWAAPTNGAPVVQYFVEHSINGGDWVRVATVSTNSYDLNAEAGESHRIRVAGVDSTGRQGSWSLPSDSYTPDLGAPGQPGQPYLAP